MKIIVAHPGKQHVYKLVNALSELGLHNIVFCSSVAFQTADNKIISRLFAKRVIGNSEVKIKTFFFLEVFRLISLRLFSNIAVQYRFERMFDFFTSKWLKKQEFDIFIGYECSSSLCLKVCKEKNKIGILDLAQIHYKTLENLGKEYDCLRYLLGGNTRININKTKEKEYQLSKYIFSISSLVKESLVVNKIHIRKIFDLPIGNNFSTKKYKKNNESTFQILYVGTIRDQKGIRLLINTIDQTNNANIRLKLIGQINEPHYHELINSRSYITHIPYVANNRLNEHYQQSDLFILPSYLDSWGMVVIEAMSNGLPVIITENCGAKDAVRQGGGFVVNPGNQFEIKNAIEFYLLNEDKRDNDALIARDIARQYDQEHYKQKLSKILDQLSKENKIYKKD